MIVKIYIDSLCVQGKVKFKLAILHFLRHYCRKKITQGIDNLKICKFDCLNNYLILRIKIVIVPLSSMKNTTPNALREMEKFASFLCNKYKPLKSIAMGKSKASYSSYINVLSKHISIVTSAQDITKVRLGNISNS